MDALFQNFCAKLASPSARSPAHRSDSGPYRLLEAVQTIRNDIALLEEQREETGKRLERGESFFRKFMNSGAPADLKASLNDLELRLKHQELKLEELAPQIDSARQKLDFFVKDHSGKLGEYLNEPENAKRLFDAGSANEAEAPVRERLLLRLLDRLEQHQVLYHVLAGYEIRPIVFRVLPADPLAAVAQALCPKRR